MENFNTKLLLGYIFSKEYLGDFFSDKRYEYAYSQAILYLTLPYRFHISGVFCIILSRFMSSHSEPFLFLSLIIVLFLSSLIPSAYFKKKYPASKLRDEALGSTPEMKKKVLKNSTVFFVLNVIVFLMIEIPLIFVF